MTIEEFNLLVDEAYNESFAYEGRLALVYENAYARQTALAAKRFSAQTVTAAWTPPLTESLTEGINAKEKAEADRVRDEAAAAIALIFASLGIAVSSREFMEAISKRAEDNFAQEIYRQLRQIVETSFDAGLSAEETAAAIRAQIPEIIPASAQMLAQTELTALVNERSMAAAQATFPQGVNKTWLTVGDNRVRMAHASAQGQTVPIEQPFSIGGASLMYPGDPSGPLRLVARCRCRLSYTNDPAAVVVASAKEDTLMDMEPIVTFHPDLSQFPDSIIINTGEGDAVATLENGVHYTTNTGSVTAGLQVTITETEEADDVETPEEDAAEPGEETMPMADGPAWRALLAVEGVATEDGRMLAEGSLTWRDLPLSLTAMDTSNHGELGPARVAGRIDKIWRDGSEVWGEGVFNTDEFGTHIAELVSNQSLRGNSIEPAVVSAEIWDRETMKVLTAEEVMDAQLNDRPLLTVFTEAIIMCSTVVATPALGEANIMLASGLLHTLFYCEEQDTLTASAAGMVPLHPPAGWFEKPSLMGPTALTITSEGQVWVHAALWESCHIGEPSGPGVCVPPPRSGMNYEIFHHGAVTTAEGHDVPVGQLTLGTTHAGRDLGWKETMSHYENSGLAFADVHAYEDRFGIVLAGALRPDVPASKVREAKAGALSGDWRQVIGRGLEFIAALVVNVPGFPIPRPEARIVASAAGEEEILALVAAGMVELSDEVEGMSRREYLRKIRVLTSVTEEFKTYSAEQRRKMAKNGQALPDGSFPIADCSDAANAIRSVGRASNPGQAKAHIRKRVRALGCSGGLYDNWK